MGEIFSKTMHGDPHESYEMPKSVEPRKENVVKRRKHYDSTRLDEFKEFHNDSFNDTAPINNASQELCKQDSEMVGINLLGSIQERPSGIITKAEVATELAKITEHSSQMIQSLTKMPCISLTDKLSKTMANNMDLMSDCIKHHDSMDKLEPLETMPEQLANALPEIVDKSEMGGKPENIIIADLVEAETEQVYLEEDKEENETAIDNDDHKENDEREEEELAELIVEESEENDDINDIEEAADEYELENDENVVQDEDDDDDEPDYE